MSPSLIKLLNQPALAIGRQLEMLNIFLGYEQANRYVITDPISGQPLAYLLEEGTALTAALKRQVLGTHRPLSAVVVGLDGEIMLRLKRPFAFINSRLRVHIGDQTSSSSPSILSSLSQQQPDDDAHTSIGEVHQSWHLWRRRYDLFVGNSQFAAIDAPFLAWDFVAHDAEGRCAATVSKRFNGVARELLTDTSAYLLRMSPRAPDFGADRVVETKLSLDERAVVLATAMSIDFDYFSRHSGHGGLPFFYFPFFGGGGSDE
jgi:hypothetical protein